MRRNDLCVVLIKTLKDIQSNKSLSCGQKYSLGGYEQDLACGRIVKIFLDVKSYKL